MGIKGGPRICCEDSLILYLDAANNASYSGGGSFWYDLSPNTSASGSASIQGPAFDSEYGGTFVFISSESDYMELSDGDFQFGTSGFTIEMWHKYPGGNVNSCLLAKRDPVTPFPQYQFYLQDGNPYGGPGSGSIISPFLRQDGGSDPTDRYPTHSLDSSTPGIYNFVVTNDSTDARLYVNGELKDTDNQSQGGSPTYNIPQENLRIGWNSATSYATGSIFVVKIYNKKLNASEVKQNYDALKYRFNL